MKYLTSIVLITVLALPVGGGCATQEPQSPAAGLTQPVAPPVLPSPGRAPGTAEVEDIAAPYNMYVSESVRLVCSGPDPFFAFDVSKPMLADQPTMNNLVACLTAGALRGKTIKVIGHTDPRGTAVYNERLGLQRAEKVKSFLVTNGIDAARVLTASMGAKDAAEAPKDWATDRRVQIQLVP